jgi:hypothetical protein
MMQSSRPFEGGSSTGENECKQIHYNIDTAESPQDCESDLLVKGWHSVGQQLGKRWTGAKQVVKIGGMI